MFRSHPGGWNAARQAVFALIPVMIGAGVLMASGDAPLKGASQLEATGAPVAPLLERAPVVAAEAVAAEGVPAAAPEVLAPAGEETQTAPAPTVPGTVVAVAAAPVDGAVVAPEAGTAGGSAASAGGDERSAPTAMRTPATDPPVTTSPSTSSSTTSTTTAAPVRAPRSRHAGAEAEVVPLTNQDRVAAGLGTLSRDPCLDGVASGYAEQMAGNGVLAHNPGAGTAVPGCRPGATWGDNVGTSSPCDTARLEREWMASPSHRRNILTGAFTRIGVGAWTDEKGACWVQVLFST